MGAFDEVQAEPTEEDLREMGTPERAATLNEIAAAAYGNSRAHGFWSDEPTDDAQAMLHYLGNKLMLIVGEVSEAHEELRLNRLVGWTREDGKPEGLPSELADVIVRVGDLAKRLGIDLDGAVAEKMAYNATRPFKHGKTF